LHSLVVKIARAGVTPRPLVTRAFAAHQNEANFSCEIKGWLYALPAASLIWLRRICLLSNAGTARSPGDIALWEAAAVGVAFILAV